MGFIFKLFVITVFIVAAGATLCSMLEPPVGRIILAFIFLTFAPLSAVVGLWLQFKAQAELLEKAMSLAEKAVGIETPPRIKSYWGKKTDEHGKPLEISFGNHEVGAEFSSKHSSR